MMHHSALLSITSGNTEFLCINNVEVPLSSCYLLNVTIGGWTNGIYINPANFTESANYTGQSVLSNLKKYVLFNTEYASGYLNISVVPLINLTNSSFLVRDYNAQNGPVSSSFGGQMQAGKIYYGEVAVNQTFLHNFPELCVAQECQILNCVTIAPNLNAPLTPINATSISTASGIYCSFPPQYWLNTLSYMSNAIGPRAPKVLAWWDYGDWIKWYGNSRPVLTSNISIPTEDYGAAAQYVLGINDSYNAKALATFMDSAQAEYVLFDDQLLPKWSAL